MRIRPLVFSFLMAVALVGPVAAAEPFRLGVLRGPTAIAFAPLIKDSTTVVNGRPLEFEIFPSPDVLVARIVAGDVQAAAIPSNLAVQLYTRGVPLLVVGTFIWGVLYLVGPPSTLSDVREIYAPGRGATPDLVLRYLLRRRGMESEVAVRYGFGPVELAQLLIAGRLDYAVLPEPFVTRVLLATDDRVVVADLQEEWWEATGQAMPQTVLVVVGSVSPDMQESLLNTLSGSVDELTSNPTQALSQVESLGLGLDAETAVAALPRLNLRVESGSESRVALERYFTILEQFDPAAIGGSLPDAGFYGF